MRCRDIYYCDPTGFGSQRVVDNVIEDIAHTIGVNRLELNVVLFQSLFFYYFA